MSQVSKQLPVLGYFWLISANEQPNLNWEWRNGWTKRLKKVAKKIFDLQQLKGKCMKKIERKFSNQSGDVILTSIYFAKYRTNFSEVFAK